MPGVPTNCRHLKGLQKGLLFVTVCQVRVTGAGEGPGVQGACVRSKWNGGQGVSGNLRNIPRERRRQSERERERVHVCKFRARTTYVKDLNDFCRRKEEEKGKSKVKEGGGGKNPSRLTH